jgi:hypothetical protein
MKKREASPKAIVPRLTGAQRSFNVKLISPISAAGAYRVFVEQSDLLFIQTEGGTKSILAALAPLLGPLGNVIPLGLWLFTRKKTRDWVQKLDQEKPEELLRESEKNFRLHLSEIRDAAIEPPATFATGGKAGRLILTVRHGEVFRFEFENGGEMSSAMHLLAPLIHSTLRINVEWNGEKLRFEKKKNDLTRQSQPARLSL